MQCARVLCIAQITVSLVIATQGGVGVSATRRNIKKWPKNKVDIDTNHK